MGLLTKNAIYRKSKCNLPYREFIDRQSNIYDSLVEEGVLDDGISFEGFLNAKFNPEYTKASGGILGSLSDILEKAQQKTKEKIAGTKQGDSPSTVAYKKKTILGLNPIVAYSILGVGVLGIGTFIYLKVKQKK